MRQALKSKLEAVRAAVTRQGRADAALPPLTGIVSVSGGLDSRLLAHVLRQWDLPFTAVHVTGPHIPMRESARAVAWLAAQGRPFHTVEADPLNRVEVLHNGRQRCYVCKGVMFRRIASLARELGAELVVEGSHADDLQGYRPGLTALAELGVVSPWALAGIRKAELRELARELGLADPEQPSRPCLFTRLEYGMIVSAELLRKTAEVEQEVEGLGLRDFRLRLHADGRIVVQIHARERGHARGHERAVLAMVRERFATPPQILYSETVSGYFDDNAGQADA
ncbi:asparagine synthase [Desulfovibrio sp. X2]|uniref:asparagine synthase n=1 Tax=Desulfovibrio sp. X2 TaxID=941449 RepID=UPI00035870A9|nr:asparagine synthase [Desulfovibrio sp. X2]EPR44045.1 asparagine synthase [Desulfovibrio sp. X2]